MIWTSIKSLLFFFGILKNKEKQNDNLTEETTEIKDTVITPAPADEREPIEVFIETIEEEAKPKVNPNKNKLIILNAGHGLNTQGKRTPLFEDKSYIKEYEFNKPIAEKAKVYAEKLGYECIIANLYDIEDANPNIALNIAIGHINRIATKAKKEGKEVICISIHCNAHQPNFPRNEWNDASGTVSFYYEQKTKDKEGKEIILKSKEGEKLAIAIHKEMVKQTGLPDRAFSFNRGKALGANFGVLRNTVCTTALVECAFMTNRRDADFLKSEKGQAICAKGIITGANTYFWE
jgi:N-acetylmuramoyl-L-alanine amidase